MSNSNEIHPIFDKMLTRDDREKQLSQRAVMIWLTGLSGSGQSTLAVALERELYRHGFVCRVPTYNTILTGCCQSFFDIFFQKNTLLTICLFFSHNIIHI